MSSHNTHKRHDCVLNVKNFVSPKNYLIFALVKKKHLVMHRIIDCSYGEVLIDMNGDCYIGDNYDQYIGHIECRNIKGVKEKTLIKKVDAMLSDSDFSIC